IIRLVGVYSGPRRDPRGRTISVAYLCEAVAGRLEAMDDAANAEWVPIPQLANLKIAFDHVKMLRDAGF
ncbi:MAG: NUDIX hydrolase, partial [Promethearchaeota archaeon]